MEGCVCDCKYQIVRTEWLHGAIQICEYMYMRTHTDTCRCNMPISQELKSLHTMHMHMHTCRHSLRGSHHIIMPIVYCCLCVCLCSLEVLYLGGNKLSELPAEVGHLHCLNSLVLCDNRLESLPPSLINLQRLQSLSLHSNNLSTLPPEIVKLNLEELSLRCINEDSPNEPMQL